MTEKKFFLLFIYLFPNPGLLKLWGQKFLLAGQCSKVTDYKKIHNIFLNLKYEIFVLLRYL